MRKYDTKIFHITNDSREWYSHQIEELQKKYKNCTIDKISDYQNMYRDGIAIIVFYSYDIPNRIHKTKVFKGLSNSK